VWAWKNDRGSEYIGMMYYRRVFLFREGFENDVNYEVDRVIVPSINEISYQKYGWLEHNMVNYI